MNKIVLSLCAIVLVAACAGSAGAQCDFNSLAKAKGFKTSMVRVFLGCPSATGGHTSINTATGGGTPACAPVMPKPYEGDSTGYMFDPQTGGCDVQTKAKLEKDCSLLADANGDPLGLRAGPCHVTYVKSKCTGIWQDAGGTPINATEDAGWSLSVLMRISLNDDSNGDMTVIDVPITFGYGNPNNGQIKLSSSTAEAMAGILTIVSDTGLPTCTTLQTVTMSIKDPNGLPFATIGGSTRAKDE
ncbi:MAG: hypothetical protein HY899_09305 [Deltaproteobacteria bacterium]|nr:hypothetical protein [Deltaproteobacteria bacterium]